MTRPNFLKLAASLFMCQGASLIGGLVTYPSISGWYAGIEKPGFNPPNWIFAPVWAVLYVLMGIAFYLVWKEAKSSARDFGIRLFIVQLIINIAWSFIFFGFHHPWAAFADILCLWGAIFLTIHAFKNISKIASLLLWPYLAWVSFAGVLNFFIAQLN